MKHPHHSIGSGGDSAVASAASSGSNDNSKCLSSLSSPSSGVQLFDSVLHHHHMDSPASSCKSEYSTDAVRWHRALEPSLPVELPHCFWLERNPRQTAEVPQHFVVVSQRASFNAWVPPQRKDLENHNQERCTEDRGSFYNDSKVNSQQRNQARNAATIHGDCYSSSDLHHSKQPSRTSESLHRHGIPLHETGLHISGPSLPPDNQLPSPLTAKEPSFNSSSLLTLPKKHAISFMDFDEGGPAELTQPTTHKFLSSHFSSPQQVLRMVVSPSAAQQGTASRVALSSSPPPLSKDTPICSSGRKRMGRKSNWKHKQQLSLHTSDPFIPGLVHTGEFEEISGPEVSPLYMELRGPSSMTSEHDVGEVPTARLSSEFPMYEELERQVSDEQSSASVSLQEAVAHLAILEAQFQAQSRDEASKAAAIAAAEIAEIEAEQQQEQESLALATAVQLVELENESEERARIKAASLEAANQLAHLEAWTMDAAAQVVQLEAASIECALAEHTDMDPTPLQVAARIAQMDAVKQIVEQQAERAINRPSHTEPLSGEQPLPADANEQCAFNESTILSTSLPTNNAGGLPNSAEVGVSDIAQHEHFVVRLNPYPTQFSQRNATCSSIPSRRHSTETERLDPPAALRRTSCSISFRQNGADEQPPARAMIPFRNSLRSILSHSSNNTETQLARQLSCAITPGAYSCPGTHCQNESTAPDDITTTSSLQEALQQIEIMEEQQEGPTMLRRRQNLATGSASDTRTQYALGLRLDAQPEPLLDDLTVTSSPQDPLQQIEGAEEHQQQEAPTVLQRGQTMPPGCVRETTSQGSADSPVMTALVSHVSENNLRSSTGQTNIRGSIRDYLSRRFRGGTRTFTAPQT